MTGDLGRDVRNLRRVGFDRPTRTLPGGEPPIEDHRIRVPAVDEQPDQPGGMDIAPVVVCNNGGARLDAERCEPRRPAIWIGVDDVALPVGPGVRIHAVLPPAVDGTGDVLLGVTGG